MPFSQHGRISSRCGDRERVTPVASQRVAEGFQPALSTGAEPRVHPCQHMLQPGVGVRHAVSKIHLVLIEREHVRPSRCVQPPPPRRRTRSPPSVVSSSRVVAAIKTSAVPPSPWLRESFTAIIHVNAGAGLVPLPAPSLMTLVLSTSCALFISATVSFTAFARTAGSSHGRRGSPQLCVGQLVWNVPPSKPAR